MNEIAYLTLEQVVQDDVFPEVDMALRRGRHIDLDDTDWFAFLKDAQPHLETFYRRFGCELSWAEDGYFYLVPTGQRLGRRHLGAGEMLVGQALALMLLDPAHVAQAGVVPVDQVLELLVSLVGEDRIVTRLNPRKRQRADARVARKTAREELRRAVRKLAALGFVDLHPDDRLRLRAALMRFTDPIRGTRDLDAALRSLVSRGEVVSVAAQDDDETVEEASHLWDEPVS